MFWTLAFLFLAAAYFVQLFEAARNAVEDPETAQTNNA